MQLTQESLYALEGVAYLSTRRGEVVSLQEIAEARELPASFLAKIFQKLARHGIVSAERGRGRGYGLARGADEITVREVLSAVEGPEALDRCFFWSGRCADANPCPLHYRFRELRPVLEQWLNEITLDAFAARWKRRRARVRRRTAVAMRSGAGVMASLQTGRATRATK